MLDDFYGVSGFQIVKFHYFSPFFTIGNPPSGYNKQFSYNWMFNLAKNDNEVRKWNVLIVYRPCLNPPFFFFPPPPPPPIEPPSCRNAIAFSKLSSLNLL